MPADVTVAVDAGGTMIKSGLVALDGSVLQSQRHPTGAERGPQAVVDTILQLAAGLADAARAAGMNPRAVGVAVPGVVDETAGIAVWSANLGLREVPLRDLAARLTGLPTTVHHDVRAGGAAEAKVGAGQAARDMLFVAVGTGVAAAHLVDGQARTGARGAAGELGHVQVRPNGPPCACGGRGCLEAVASGPAIARRHAELGGGELDAAGIAAAVAAGDATATRVWREAVDALADGLVTAQAVLDTEVIVLSGGVAAAGETLLSPLLTAVKERITFHQEPAIVPGALGDLASCVGAGLHAWDASR